MTAKADWYPDPAGRFEWRYWDGSGWTANVSRAGASTTDPEGVPAAPEPGTTPPPPPPPPGAPGASATPAPDPGADTPVLRKMGEYLDRYGWRVHQGAGEAGEAEGVVLTAWTAQMGGQYMLSIDPQMEKEVIAFRTIGLAMAPRDATPAARLNDVFFAMAVINAGRLIGAWAYVPSSGEIVFRASVPFLGELEYDAFKKIMDLFTLSVELEAPQFQGIVDGTTTAEALLKSEGLLQ